MELVYNAIQGVLTILLMVGVGYVISKKWGIEEKDSAFLSHLVLNFALPALMFSNFTRNFTRETLFQLGPGLVVPLSVILGSYGVAAILGKLLRLPLRTRGTFRALFSFSNSIFVGLPVNIALFGEQAVPFVTLYYIVNTPLFWTLGVYYIRKDAEGNNRTLRFFSWETIRRLFNPVLKAFLLAIVFVLLEIPLPRFVSAAFKFAADMTIPLSMLIIGVTMQSIGFKGIKFDRFTWAVLGGKFILCPAIAWGVLSLIDTPELMRNVFLVVASLPVMTQVAIVSKAFGVKDDRASYMVTLTTVLSLGIIPIYMLLFTL